MAKFRNFRKMFWKTPKVVLKIFLKDFLKTSQEKFLNKYLEDFLMYPFKFLFFLKFMEQSMP